MNIFLCNTVYMCNEFKNFIFFISLFKRSSFLMKENSCNFTAFISFSLPSSSHLLIFSCEKSCTISMNLQVFEAGCLHVMFFYIHVFTKVME